MKSAAAFARAGKDPLVEISRLHASAPGVAEVIDERERALREKFGTRSDPPPPPPPPDPFTPPADTQPSPESADPSAADDSDEAYDELDDIPIGLTAGDADDLERDP